MTTPAHLKQDTIVFEFDPTATFNGLKNTDALHEALCKLIHEQDQDALTWLSRVVTDIIHPDVAD
jgi:hypothetical protein